MTQKVHWGPWVTYMTGLNQFETIIYIYIYTYRFSESPLAFRGEQLNNVDNPSKRITIAAQSMTILLIDMRLQTHHTWLQHVILFFLERRIAHRNLRGGELGRQMSFSKQRF